MKGLGEQSPGRELREHWLWWKPPETDWEMEQAPITLRI